MAAPRKARRPAADALLQAAHAAYLTGRRDEAESLLRQVLAQEPWNTAAWNNLASLLAESGFAAEAEAAYRKAIVLNPGFADFHINFALFLKNAGRVVEAEASFREAIALKPNDPPTLAHLAQLLKDSGRLTDAEALFEQTLALDPSYALAHNNLGILLLDTERAPKAEAAFRKALALDPKFPEAHANLGNALKAQEHYAEAEAQYREALALRPADKNFLNNLGAVLDDLGRLGEAEVAYQQTLAVAPDFAAAYCNLGRLMQTQGRLAEAEAAYRKAVELNADFTDAKLNLGLLLLTLGRYEEAWPWHEARHFPDSKARRAMQPPFTFPQWQGEPLAGKSLAVVLEQGHGDNIQFIRYAPLIKALGASRLTFVQPAPLVLFLATAHGLDAITPDAVSLPPHDYWCFPLSLPLHLGSTLDTLPNTLPYLWALPERVERWRPRLPASGLKVGLVWKGNPDHKNDANRSLPHLSALAPLWDVPGISFISLQKGQGQDEARLPPPGQPLLHLGDDIADFADSAAIIAQLDLVITVDSAAGHIAGALGKPVWVLLPGVGTDWRWLLEREDSPWYPGAMRLFRQPREASSWDATLREVAAALRTWSAVPPEPALPLFDRSLPELPPVLLAGPAETSAAESSSAAADALLKAAHADYLAGRRDEAEARLRELLADDPGNTAAWNNLASLLAEAGNTAEAEAAYRKAITLNPSFPDFHVNFAHFLKNAGRAGEAEAAFREAIALRPDDVNSHNHLGILLLDAGRADDAEGAFRAALALDSGFAEGSNNLGNALKAQKRLVEAEAAYREALALRPEDRQFLNNLAVFLGENERGTEAHALLQRITNIAPDFPDGWNNLGTALQNEERYAEAEAAYRKAIALNPDLAASHGNLANALKAQDRFDEAEAEYRVTLKLKPDDTDTLNNLAVLLGGIRRHEESRATFLRAIEIRPDFAAAWCNLGNIAREMSRTAEAEAAYRKAVELNADFTDAKLNLGLLLLTLGRYEEAWPWHEARHFPDSKARRAMQPPFTFPQWQGEPLAGKSLAVVLEQGHGDNIQFIRYAPLIKALGASRLTFVQPAPLVLFLATAHGLDAITPDAVSLPPHDYWCFPLSLPLHLGSTLDTLPNTLPYLWALPERVERWRPRLPASGLKVGLVWKGNPDHKNDANRSLPHLSALAPLWDVPGISFISLQKGQGQDEARLPPPGQPLLHLGDDIADFADSAAIIAQLDLVITVDSAAGHIAGALGKPVWVLLPGVGTDWRWLLEREDSPWYPGAMRLFRQPREASSWDATLREVAAALRTWSAVPPEPALPLFDRSLPELPPVLLAGPAETSAAESSSAAADALLKAAHADYLAGRRDEAEARLRELLADDPGNTAAWNNLASLLAEAGNTAEAEAAYRKAITLNPSFPDFHVNFAHFLKNAGRAGEAEDEFQKALELVPNQIDWLKELAPLARSNQRPNEAEAAWRRLSALQPESASHHFNLALLLDKNRPRQAEVEFREALRLDANFQDAHWGLALLLLRQERWTEAWPHFDRRNDPFRQQRNDKFLCPEWRGEDLAGKSLLIDTVEGHGDNIMCARYIPQLKQAGVRRITLLHRPALKPLLETIAGVDAVMSDRDALPAHDFWCFSFALLFRFNTTPTTIPGQIPYIFPLESRMSYWRRRLAPVEGFRVGLVWKGDPNTDVDRGRSLPHLSALAPLWDVPGVSFVSLQKGQGEEEGRQPPPGQPLLHLGGDIADFADTAAIIAQLDLLISVCTSSAHVAGALGRPVWVLLSYPGDWRWLGQDRFDTPWYPGVMRLFRQMPEAPDWEAEIREVAAALAARVLGEAEPVPPPRAVALVASAETTVRPPDREHLMNRPAPRPVAFVLTSSDHGTMIVNRNDFADQGGGRGIIGVGCQILYNSSFDRDEVDLALRMIESRRRLFGDGVTALDCGANIGVHTIEWARLMQGWGSVTAVEAQERVFYALCGNITINNCFNARAIWGAVGEEDGEILVPRPDYLRPGSYGSLEIRPSARNEFIGQAIDYSEQAGQRTRLFTIDSLALARLDFIKIDIEGMEMEALAGAINTIRRFRPQMIIEKIKSDETALRAWLVAEGYRMAPFGGNLVAIHGSDPSHEQFLA